MNRSRGRAEALAGSFGPSIEVLDWEEREAALSGCGLLVNATSLGMEAKPPLELSLATLPADAVVADIVYSPLTTPLLAAARARGNPAVDGLGMLLHQAVPGFERWFGVRPEVTPGLRAEPRGEPRGTLMLVIGLTGSIGMGKSAAAAHFARRGVPVFDADAEVHRLYAGEAVRSIEAAFPGVTREGRIDRDLLAREVAASPAKLEQLERIVHPMVVKAEIAFLRDQEKEGRHARNTRDPLLFETGAETRVDTTLVVSAPEAIQKQRVLARPAMTQAKLAGLLARQLPDADKRARADFIVDSGTSLADMRGEIDRLIESDRSRAGA